MAVGAWEIAPSEFWAMTPREWWAVFDIKRADRDRVSKRLSKRQADDLLAWAEQDAEQQQLLRVAHGIDR